MIGTTIRKGVEIESWISQLPIGRTIRFFNSAAYIVHCSFRALDVQHPQQKIRPTNSSGGISAWYIPFFVQFQMSMLVEIC